jgi:plasmid stabilization system protein ParE
MGSRILFQRYESHNVYYRFNSKRVEILRLLHTKRDQKSAYG